jgi:hypothetical protein
MKVRFPHFPELSFEEFLDMQQFAFVSRRTRSSYLSPRLMDGILHRERFFFQLFPEYLPKDYSSPYCIW